MNNEELVVGAFCAARLRGGRIEWAAWPSPSQAFHRAAELPPEVGPVAGFAPTLGGVFVVNLSGDAFGWDSTSGKWQRLGSMAPPAQPAETGPVPGTRGVLRPRLPLDGSRQAPLIACTALRGFSIGAGLDCVPGDPLELDFERVLRLSSGAEPMVKVTDTAAFRRATERVERAAVEGRG